jgi:hypothetical protein
MTRTGKIARLPRDIRDQLNRRLHDGEPGVRLIEWLNGLEPVRQILAQDFGGREISEQNLSEWKQGGYKEWLTQQELLACARELAADAETVIEEVPGALSDHLATILTARYARLVSGQMDEAQRREARALRALCQDIVELRRGDHYAQRLKLDLDRFAEARKSNLERALDALAEHIKESPAARQAFNDFSAVLRQHQPAKP